MKIAAKLIIFALAGAALAGAWRASADQPPAPPAPSGEYGGWGFDLTGMAGAARPGDDFFAWVNGGWVSRTEIPADRTGYSSLGRVSEEAERRAQQIVTDAAEGRLQGADATRIGGAFRAFMDEAEAERRDARPLAPKLAAIRAVADRRGMARLMGRVRSQGYVSVVNAGIGEDARDPTRFVVSLYTAGLGLPDRDYYLDAGLAEKRAAYRAYVAQMLDMAGWPDSAAAADAVLAFETRLAQASWTRAERRDRERAYRPMTLAELQAYAPGLDWRALLGEAGVAGQERFIVTADSALQRTAAIYAETPLDVLKAWQAFHVADEGAPYLSARFVAANFEFQSRTLYGTPQQRPRWRRAVAFVNGALGQAIGRLYVERHFPAAAQAEVEAIVSNLRAAQRARIAEAGWLGAPARAEALRKLDAMVVLVGRPARWRDYGELAMDPRDLYGNVDRARAFEWRRRVAMLGGAVDRGDWDNVTPQTVNAAYNPSRNQIIVTAAMLAAPFFGAAADPAVNYGAIGAIIGHEMSHGFDDQGRRFDADGRLRDWWSDEEAAHFRAEADKIGAQFGAYEPLPGLRINPQLTMGENIADLAGLQLALDAYRLSLAGRPDAPRDGYGGTQRLFLGFAQAWRIKKREDSLREQLLTDPHAPSQYRVNGVVRNLDAWYAAFGVGPGAGLYLPPAERARLW